MWHGTVTAAGKVEFDVDEQPQRRQHLEALAGARVDVIVRKHRKQRSAKQNAWHWDVAIPLIAESFGYDRDEHEALHYGLLDLCFGTHFDERLKVWVPNVAHSSELDTTQFSELMEWEVRWAAKEHGLVIPLPGESA